VRDEDRVVPVHHRPVGLQEVQQMRHLLEIGRYVGDVSAQVDVVELYVDDVLDLAACGLQLTRAVGRHDRGDPYKGHGDGDCPTQAGHGSENAFRRVHFAPEVSIGGASQTAEARLATLERRHVATMTLKRLLHRPAREKRSSPRRRASRLCASLKLPRDILTATRDGHQAAMDA